MAIRIRQVDGITVALCAARSVEKEGDIYLDDDMHQALATKFAIDFNSTKLWEGENEIPFDPKSARLIYQEESDNINREWWDKTYDPSFNEYFALIVQRTEQ